jgi:hypothetical protein
MPKGVATVVFPLVKLAMRHPIIEQQLRKRGPVSTLSQTSLS